MEPVLSSLRAPSRTFGRVVAIGAVLATGALVPGFSADAAPVPGAITGVDIRETKVDLYSSFRLNLTWAVPESASAGDTFTLTLPDQLVAVDGTTFDLLSEGGDVVARAKVVGGVVTFTLTSFADTHQRVHGSAWFYVQLRRGAVPGQSLNLRFTSGGEVFTDTLDVTGAPHDYSSAATKWMAWVDPLRNDPPLRAEDVLLWSIVAPRVTKETSGAKVTFIDEPGPGSKIDCATIIGFWGTTNTGGADAASFMGSNRYTKTCTPDRLEVVLTTSKDDVGKIPWILGHSYLTGTKQEVYRNTGHVLVERAGQYTVSDTVRWGGGGDGAGDVPTATATTVPPTGTPTSVPPTGPGTSVPPTTSATPTTSTTPPTAPGTTTSTSTPPVASGTPTTSGPPSSTTTTTTTLPPVAPGTTAPTATAPSTPPLAGGTTTPAAGTSTPPLSGGTAAPSPNPSTPALAPGRIDTGEPDVVSRNGWLVTAGIALIAAAGLGLIGLSRGRRGRNRS